MGYKNCKKSNFSIRYTSRLNTFHTHIIYTERERERVQFELCLVSVMKCFAAGVCFVAVLNVCLALYICWYAYTRDVHWGESTRGCVVFFFLKAGVFEMNLTCVVSIVVTIVRYAIHTDTYHIVCKKFCIVSVYCKCLWIVRYSVRIVWIVSYRIIHGQML